MFHSISCKPLCAINSCVSSNAIQKSPKRSTHPLPAPEMNANDVLRIYSVCFLHTSFSPPSSGKRGRGDGSDSGTPDSGPSGPGSHVQLWDQSRGLVGVTGQDVLKTAGCDATKRLFLGSADVPPPGSVLASLSGQHTFGNGNCC